MLVIHDATHFMLISTPLFTMMQFFSAALTVLSWTLVTSFHSLPQTRRRFIPSTLFTTSLTKAGYPRHCQPLSMTISSVLGEFIPVTMEELLTGIVPCEVTIKPPALHNKYYGLRHGESMANLEGIISSDPGRGTTIHGLTETGRKHIQTHPTAHCRTTPNARFDFLHSHQTHTHPHLIRQRAVTTSSKTAVRHRGHGRVVERPVCVSHL